MQSTHRAVLCCIPSYTYPDFQLPHPLTCSLLFFSPSFLYPFAALLPRFQRPPPHPHRLSHNCNVIPNILSCRPTYLRQAVVIIVDSFGRTPPLPPLFRLREKKVVCYDFSRPVGECSVGLGEVGCTSEYLSCCYVAALHAGGSAELYCVSNHGHKVEVTMEIVWATTHSILWCFMLWCKGGRYPRVCQPVIVSLT